VWEDGWAVGDPERANTFVGEAIGLIRTIDPAGAVVERMAAEAAALLAKS
jgi:nitronate monooxygenase